MKARRKKIMTFLLSLLIAAGAIVGGASRTSAAISVTKTDLPGFKNKVHAKAISKGTPEFTYNTSAFDATVTNYNSDSGEDKYQRKIVYFKSAYSEGTHTVANPYKIVYKNAFSYDGQSYDYVVECTSLTMYMPKETDSDGHSNHGLWHKNKVVVADFNITTGLLYSECALWYGGSHSEWTNKGEEVTKNTLWGFGPSRYAAGIKATIKNYVCKNGETTPVSFSEIPRMYTEVNDLDIPDSTGAGEDYSGTYTESVSPGSGFTNAYIANDTLLDPSAYGSGLFRPKDGTGNQDDTETKKVTVYMATDNSGASSSATYTWYGCGCGTGIYGAYIIRNVANLTIKKKVNSRNAEVKLAEPSLAGINFKVKAAETIKDPLDGSVIYSSGATVATVTTDAKGSAKAKKLPVGSYTVEELNAPPELIISDASKNVSIGYNSDGTAVGKTATFTNPTTLVSVKKVNEYGETLDGGTFSIIEKSTGQTVATFTTGGGVQTISGLKKSTAYILREVAAPAYYQKSDDVEFISPSDQTVKNVVMSDIPATRDLTMAKTIKASDVELAHGEPTFFVTARGNDFRGTSTYRTVSFTFTKQMIQDAVNGASYTKVITNTGSTRYKSKIAGSGESDSERYINAQGLTVSNGYITLSETVKMRYGSYDVTESQAARYTFESASAVNGTISGSTGNVNLYNTEWGKVGFTNRYTRYDKWSHRDSARNHFETSSDNGYILREATQE